MSVDEDSVYNDALDKAMGSGDMDTAKEIAGMIAERRNARMAAAPAAPASTLDTSSGLANTARGVWRGLKGAADFAGSTITNAGEGALTALSGGAAPDVPRAPNLVNPNDPNDKALMATKGGKLGDMAGNVLATLPVGGVGGEINAAAKGLPLAARALTRVGVGAGEGAIGSAADGGSAGEGAVGGGLLSGAMGALGKTATGLVNKSPAAQALIDKAKDIADKDLFIPISEGGGKIARGLYKTMSGLIPGVDGQLSRQSRKADDVLQYTKNQMGVADQVDPAGLLVTPKIPEGLTPQQQGEFVKRLKDQQYQESMNSQTLDHPGDFRQSVIDRLQPDANFPNPIPQTHQHLIANEADQVFRDFTDGSGAISGANFQEAKGIARQRLNDLTDSRGVKIGNPVKTEQAMRAFEDIPEQNIADAKNAADLWQKLGGQQSGQYIQSNMEKVRNLSNYQKINQNYANARTAINTSEAQPQNFGRATGAQIAKEAPDLSEMQTFGQNMNQVQGDKEPMNSLLKHALTASKLAGGATAALYHPVPAAIGLVGGNALATKTAQKALYGDYGRQQALANQLRKPGASVLGNAAQQALIDQGQGQ